MLTWVRPQPLLRTWLRLRGVQQQQHHSASPTLSQPPQPLRTPQPGLIEGHRHPPHCTRWCARCVRLLGRPGATACSSIFRAAWQPWALHPSHCRQALSHLRYIVISSHSLISTPLYLDRFVRFCQTDLRKQGDVIGQQLTCRSTFGLAELD